MSNASDAAPARIRPAETFFAFVVVAAVHLGSLPAQYAALSIGQLADADSYLRLLRVLDLREGGLWFAATTQRLSPPEGLSLHWTRPLDVLILLPARAIEAITELAPKQSILLVGIVISPILHALAAVAAAWAAAGIWPGRASWYAVLAMVAVPAATSYASAGRADHHALILVAVTLALGASLRALATSAPRLMASVAGSAFGFAVWVSPEALLIAGPVLLATGVAALIAEDGHPTAGQGMRMAMAMAAMLTLAVVIERPPSQWFVVEYDRVSVHHVTVALLACVSFVVLLPWAGASRPRRAAVGGAACLVAFGVLITLFPEFLAGSIASADAPSRAILLPNVDEMRPLPPIGPGSLRETAAVLGGPPLAALVALGIAAPGWRQDGRWQAGLALAACLLFALGAAFAARRFALDLAAPAAIGAAGLVGALTHVPWPRRASIRNAVAAALFIGSLALPLVTVLPAGTPASAALTSACDGAAFTRWLDAARPGLSEANPSPVIMAEDINLGPEIIWRSPFRAVAGPYHRGGAAVADTFTVLEARERGAARAVIERRGVSFLLICNSAAAVPGTFAAGLRDDDLPPWLTSVPLPDHLGEFRLFAVTQRD